MACCWTQFTSHHHGSFLIIDAARNKLSAFKSFLTCFICHISSVLRTRSLNSADVPLNNKHTAYIRRDKVNVLFINLMFSTAGNWVAYELAFSSLISLRDDSFMHFWILYSNVRLASREICASNAFWRECYLWRYLETMKPVRVIIYCT